jgi:hypothetical protein
MTACDAITVAAVARITIAIRPQSGTSRKNGALRFAWSERISAPWPM